MATRSMCDNILLLTPITVYFPFSILAMLWLLGWDETVRIFREIVIETVGQMGFLVSAAVMMLLAIGIVALVIALAAR